MKNEYDALNRAVMDLAKYESPPLEQGQRAALAAMLRGAGPERAEAPRPGRRRWAVLAVAAALACCALGVGAASRFEWGKELAAFLGVEQSAAETLGVPGVGLGLTKALGGGKVTLEGVLGDDHCVYISRCGWSCRKARPLRPRAIPLTGLRWICPLRAIPEWFCCPWKAGRRRTACSNLCCWRIPAQT